MSDVAVIGIQIQTSGSERAAKSLADLAASGKKAEDAVGGLQGSSERAQRSLASLGGIAAGVAASMGASELIRLTDEYTRYSAQLKLATTNTAAYVAAMGSVRAISTAAQQDISAVGTLFARISNGTRELGLSQQKMSSITETVALSLKVSGAAASESASAMLQLSQAFASGQLRGEEFNAVNEAAPRLMKALADGIGVPIGALRELASQGKITSEVMANALPRALADLREEAKSVQTIAGAFTVLKNNVLEFVGTQAQASGAVQALTSGITGLANNLDLITAAAGGLAAAKLADTLLGVGAATARGVGSTVAYAEALSVQRAASIAAAQADVGATAATVARMEATQAAILVSREEYVARLATANAAISTSQASLQQAAAVIASSSASLQAARSAGALSFALATARESSAALTGAQAAQAAATAALAQAERQRVASLAELAILGQQQVRVSAQVTAAATAQAAAQTALATATAAGGAASGLAMRALGVLGGPIGAVTTLLGLGATAWMLWGSSSKSAQADAKAAVESSTADIIANLDKQNAKLRERIELGKQLGLAIGQEPSDAQRRQGQIASQIADLQAGRGVNGSAPLPEAARVSLLQTLLRQYGELNQKINEGQVLKGEDEQTKAANALIEVRHRLLGVNKQYLEDLKTLQEAFRTGAIKSEADYIKEVSDLAKRTYESSAAGKAAKDGAAGLSDELRAQVQTFKNADREILDGRKDFYAQLDLMSKTGRVGELDAIRQSLTEEERVWTARKANFEAELAAASQKKNSQAEVARITGQMQEAERDYAQKQVELTNKITVAEYKRAEAIKDVIAAQKEQYQRDMADAITRTGNAWNQVIQQVNDYARGIDEANDLTQLELSLIGRGERARKIAVEQHQAMLRLKKQELEVDKQALDIGADGVAKKKAELQAAYQRELSGIEQKVILDEWKATTEEINRSLTDALMRGFESGKGFAENMRDTIVNMFKTMVLRPVISAILSPVSAALGGVVNGVLGGGVAGAVNGVSGGLNMLSTANNAYTALSGYSGGVNTLAGLLGGGQSVGSSAAALGYANTVGAAGGDALGAFFAGNASWGGVGAGSLASMGSLINGGSTVTTGLTGFYTGNLGYGVGAASNLGALGSGTYGMAPILTSSVAPGAVTGVATGAAVETGAVAAGAAAEGGMMSALASNPYGWIALAVIAAIALFSGKGEKRFGGQYEMGFDGEGKAGDISLRAGPSGGEVGGDYARQLITGTTDGINTLLKDLGSDMALTGFQAGLETSGKGRGGVYAGGTLTGGITFGESGEGNNYEGTMFEKSSTQSPNAEEAVKNFATDMLQATVQALQAATDLPKVIAQQLKGVDAEELTDEAATTLLTSIRAQIEFVKGFRDAINQLPFENLRDLSFDTATGLVTAAGGLEALNQNLTGYFSNYFSAEEQRDAAVKRLAAAFDDLDLVMPALSEEAGVSRDAFRALAEGIDVSTEAGQKQYAGLIALQGAFAELAPAVEGAAAAIKRSAADIASERDNLQRQIWSIVGDTGAIRAADLAKLDESNRPLQEQIWALQDAKAASEKAAQAQAAAAQAAASFAQAQEQAAQRVRDAWSSVGDSLIDEIKRIRGEVTDTGALGYAHLQSQFVLTTAQARAGDKAAAEALPELSQSLLEMAKDNASSAVALKQMQLQIAASLEETLRFVAKKGGFAVPAFASGGVHSGGWAMVGEQGPELAYMPPARIYTAGQTAGMLDQGAVLDELRQLRADNRAQAGEIARLHLRVAKVLEKWDGDGMPAEREESAA